MTDFLARDRAASSTRLQRVSKGLFVLRYSASAGGVRAPLVAVEADPQSGVVVLSDIAEFPPVLRAPGDAVVIQAQHDSQVRLVVHPRTTGASTDAQLVLERVSCSLSPASVAMGAAPAATNDAAAGFSVLAHVARRGDVSAAGGDWICGPDAPLALEGLQLSWPEKPEGVDVLTAAVINMRGRKVQPPARIGQFVGTRQKAAPIVGLTFNVTGALAHLYSLQVEALFLGGAVVRKSGLFIEVAGDTGLEPLVGLKINLVEQAAATDAGMPSYPFMARGVAATTVAAPVEVPSALSEPRPVETSAPGRVRVFRMPRRSPAQSSLQNN